MNDESIIGDLFDLAVDEDEEAIEAVEKLMRLSFAIEAASADSAKQVALVRKLEAEIRNIREMMR